MKRTEQVRFVPDHISFEILRSLPGKSLARFKCVCKSWHSFLSQLKYDNDHKVILSTSSSFLYVDFEAPSMNIKAVELDFPIKDISERGFRVIGSCNGLLLVIYDDGLVIWNPWTGGHKRLSYNVGDFFHDDFGFGYDHSTDDYKMVRIKPIYCTGVDQRLAKIHSLKKNSCQKKIILPWQIRSILRPLQPGNFVNGALHWLINYVVKFTRRLVFEDKDVSPAILRYDLSNQEFSIIILHEEVARLQRFTTPAGVCIFGGRLCMVDFIRKNHILCMWAREDNNNVENQHWIKLMSIPRLEETRTDGRFLIPVCLMNNSDLLLTSITRCNFVFPPFDNRRHIGEFFLYNSEEKTIKELEIDQDISHFLDHTTYTRTLVSPLMY